MAKKLSGEDNKHKKIGGFMRKEKGQKLVQLFMVLIFTVAITGCVSMAVGMASSRIRDYGVYDSSVAENQLSDFIFIGVNVRSFNGNPVNWGDRANNMGRISVPAGTHDIVYDWVQEETRQTGSSTSMGTVTVTYTTTTRSLTGLRIDQIEFLPGHKYFLGGAWVDGQVLIYMQDITNTPSQMWGDDVPNAPRASRTPTEFEGVWSGSDGTTFIFSGNSWQMIIPPGISTNFSDQESNSRGTFTVEGNKIIMHMGEINVNGRWTNVSAIRQANIWTYRFAGNNLMLEIEYLLPTVTYIKM